MKDEQIAVYDFGGGTFDLTMLRMSERELRVRATAGDMFLGGDDIDVTIANRIADAYLKEHRYDPRVDADVFARVRVAAERLKVELSPTQTGVRRPAERADVRARREAELQWSLPHDPRGSSTPSSTRS